MRERRVRTRRGGERHGGSPAPCDRRSRPPWCAARWALLALVTLGCTTSLELGERRYRDGDRLAALETWRAIPPEDFSHEAAQRRIQQVQAEFERLVTRYQKRAAYYEKRGRLAESLLNYRLGLKLKPDDQETLDRVQSLARELDARRNAATRAFEEPFAAGRLSEAANALDELRRVDPFSAELASAERRLDAARGGKIEKLLARGRRGFTSGNHRRASRAFEQVLEIDDDNESARGYLSYIEKIRTGDGREATPDEIAATGLDPSEIEATDAQIRAEGFFQNALAAERAGDLYAAIRYDITALGAHAAHPRVRNHLANLRRRLEPQLPDLLKAGREHYQQEDLQAALDQWRKVLLIDPGNEQAQDYTQRAERLLENLERLREEPAVGGGG